MIGTVFAIGDLHFGHGKVATVRGYASADEHDAVIVKRWNERVTKRDVVYVLGDVFRLERVPELNGTKKLALGNHDKFPAERYLAAGFTRLAGCFEFDGVLLSHIPVHPCQLSRWPLNVHGHMHANVVTRWRGAVNGDDGGAVVDARYLCLSAEHTTLTPVDLRQVIQQRRDDIVAGAFL